ncbi:MAG: putative ABC transporter permease [Erysipelotrichaceae bacterium]|nr:putative ABC transporter permease [Erysipelotrichaceae bacterium]
MINLYIVYFFLLSFLGYIYECLAMVLWTGKWDNRGFLFGPIIPIYGTCALGGTLFLTYVYKNYTPLSIFLLSVLVSAIVEYVVHYALEKMFHAYWWDYSKAPLNINGRISLLTSLGFGVAGLVVVYVINPYVLSLLSKIPAVAMQIMALVFVALFSADLTLTISVLSSFINRVQRLDDYINQTMDDFVNNHMNDSLRLNDKFFGAMDRIEDVRRRLINDRIDKAGKNATVLYKRILYRVRGFRGEHRDLLNRFLKRIKGEEKDE